MQNYVFCIDQNKQPLDPITPKRARQLLSKQQAAVFRLFPFTIILKKAITNPVMQHYQIKIDPGSQTTGLALVDKNGNCIWGANLKHRGSLIKKNLERRRLLRRGRRNRNTRYRQARFLNRKRQKGWLAPSLQHRVITIETWIKRLSKFVPVLTVAIEHIKFDTQLMQNSNIDGVEYQQGTLAGYEVREYLLEKWVRKCAYCDKDNLPLQIEHIHPKSKGGNNRISNLTLACEGCNQKKGTKSLEEFLKGKKKAKIEQIKAQSKKPLKDAACVNSIRWAVLKCAKKHFKNVETGSGALTKRNRIANNQIKDHWIDAAYVGESGLNVKLLTKQPLIITCNGQGGRQKAAVDKYGYPNRHRPLKPIFKWSTGDYGQHKEYGLVRVTPRSNGYFGITLKDKTNKNCKYELLKPVFRKDSYAYSFGEILPSNFKKLPDK